MSYSKTPLVLSFLCFFSLSVEGQEIRAFMDLQIHTTMHIPYCFFGEGLAYFEPDDEPKIKAKHQLRNVNYANFFEDNRGARILINGAVVPETVGSKKKARRLTLEQIQYVNDFVSTHPDHFAVARTPEEVREYVTQTDKTVFIHSIEGARGLVNSAEDAQFWADQGVAYITLIHLADNRLGASGIKPGFMAGIINFKGTVNRIFAPKKRRLKDKGRKAIRWLADAGVMIDITHMSEKTREDALDFMEAEGIPPIATHDLYRPVQNHVRGLSHEDIIRIYRNGGFVALPLSGLVLEPHKPQAMYEAQLDSLTGRCPGSIDDFKFTYQALKAFVETEIHLPQYNEATFEAATESQKVDWSIGFQTDFNGWLSHSRPRYGKKGCREGSPEPDLRIETEGLTDPGLLDEHWQILTSEGVDLTPIKRASEKFLQLWQHFLDNKK